MSEIFSELIERKDPLLIYVADPMCSWCHAYAPVYQRIREGFLADYADRMASKSSFVVTGGLAPDSDEPMPEEQQQYIRGIWQKIEATTGTRFNYDFWEQCVPRRSTWPACRAVIAARAQGLELEMLTAIQQDYYQQAKNPSDWPVLEDCARSVPTMDIAQFIREYERIHREQVLEREVEFIRRLGVQGFPTLIIKQKGSWSALPVDYLSAESALEAIGKLIT
ncbi:DsbA family protein [Oceanospirillum sediminis]|uniref:DsbA family protein n=1 Tax=Oceanospirillum sediminis TaxID=2760088 RepID=A0A839IX30_9GAMM|nr:DsbA family protein [Oceanospirillum sediminis]MBB1489250.1 DsbA family protein [Oceanospirillum sediminis]